MIQTMDIIHEKFGWMLLMLDIVMVPFIFPMQAYYIYAARPQHSTAYLLFFLAMHCIGYYIFDTANSQKDYFRENPNEAVPSGFPRLPWGRLHEPKYIQTQRGTKLLVDGWWAHARHCNYLGDLLMSWSWGLTCGYGSIFPFAYTAYLTPLLIHREIRDDRECRQKYGEDWEKYKNARAMADMPLHLLRKQVNRGGAGLEREERRVGMGGREIGDHGWDRWKGGGCEDTAYRA